MDFNPAIGDQKMKNAFLVSVIFCVSAYGQDAGTMAVQQANELAMQAQQTAQQMQDQATISNLQTTINMQQAMANTSSPGCPGPIIGAAIQPAFSVRAGKVAFGTVVRIKSATHYATIYYTTDGWSPTKATMRYTGPITINAETHLQAMALGPNLVHSSIARADYTVDTPATPSVPQTPLNTDGVLRAGTRLRLVTSTVVNSQTAQVGDKIPLLLDQDVKAGDIVIAAKGTPVDAVITIADPAEKRDVPGDLVFEIRSINVAGKSIPLIGGETLEGEHGKKPKDTIITPGMVVAAFVAADTPLKP
jgi:hypothetical protein